ncbi:MAG: hypothetical protein M0P31_18470 [Solirubrobacteraceae bacterium]|nr:hypothetical protein [Solirubrobacteraceae bacterium]
MDHPLHRHGNRERLDAARARIAGHGRTFDAFRAAALAAADDDVAVALAEAAYHWSYQRHPGRLVDPALEGLLHDVGRRRVPGRPGASHATDADAVRRVLHVATETYATGGHTRVLERWIANDAARTSTLLLLGQRTPLPPRTAAIARDAGAAIVRPPADATPLERARDLRALAALHDLVVLHTHPDDVVPALALADPVGRPPVLLFNHAGHLPWPGVGAVDAVASLWDPDVDACVTRRGLPRERSTPLPLPATARALPDRDVARRSLGIAPEAPVLVSIGSAFKVAPTLEPSFASIVRTLVERIPDLVHVAVGPGPAEAAAGLVPEHPRVRALGTLDDIGPVLAAADLMLDTWPISGATALLDGAAAGLTTVSLGDPSPDAEGSVRVPDGMLGGAVVVEGTVDALVDRTVALLGDPDERARRGAALRRYVADVHGPDGWLAAMERAVGVAVAHRGAARPPAASAADDRVRDGEAVMQLVHDDVAFTPYHAYLAAVPALPAADRPANEAELRARVDAILAAGATPGAPDAGATSPPRRAVAAPRIDAASIAGLLDTVRGHVARGDVGTCVVVVPPDDVDRAIALLEAGLAAGSDVDVELVAATDVGSVAREGDLVLTG